MTTWFYAPPDAMHGARVILPEDEARHAARVLRREVGDEIIVVDGEGGWHRVRLNAVSADQVAGTIRETRHAVGEPPYQLTLGVGLLKKRSRFETCVEKAVELGAARIVPLLTRRTEKTSARTDRLRRVARAAMKQSQRSRCPTITEPQKLAPLLQEAEAAHRIIAHADASVLPRRALSDEATNVLALVGPEGGFTDDELQAARAAGCTPVSLGTRRLRTETAALVMATAVHLRDRTEELTDSS